MTSIVCTNKSISLFTFLFALFLHDILSNEQQDIEMLRSSGKHSCIVEISKQRNKSNFIVRDF